MIVGQKAVDLEKTPCIICHSVIKNCFFSGDADGFVDNARLATVYTGAKERMAGIARINELFPGSKKRPALLIFNYFVDVAA